MALVVEGGKHFPCARTLRENYATTQAGRSWCLKESFFQSWDWGVDGGAEVEERHWGVFERALYGRCMPFFSRLCEEGKTIDVLRRADVCRLSRFFEIIGPGTGSPIFCPRELGFYSVGRGGCADFFFETSGYDLSLC